MTPASCPRSAGGSAKALAASPRRPDRDARARESGAHPAPVPRRSSSGGERTSSRRTRRGPTVSSATRRSSSAATAPRSRRFERMVSLKPSLASYARIAYARELTRRPRGSDRRDASSRSTPPAVSRSRRPGRRSSSASSSSAAAASTVAERRFRAALAIDPGYVYALEQMARVEAARGRLGAAVRLRAAGVRRDPAAAVRRAPRRPPRAPGHAAAARRQQATVAAIDRLLAANGVRVDLESAVYRADHGDRARRRPSRSHAALGPIGRRSTATTPSAGRSPARGAATRRVTWSQRSLRLGTRDALLWFHRGYAAGCAGDTGRDEGAGTRRRSRSTRTSRCASRRSPGRPSS